MVIEWYPERPVAKVRAGGTDVPAEDCLSAGDNVFGAGPDRLTIAGGAIGGAIPLKRQLWLIEESVSLG